MFSLGIYNSSHYLFDPRDVLEIHEILSCFRCLGSLKFSCCFPVSAMTSSLVIVVFKSLLDEIRGRQVL